ncbi:MAG: hypothetical protein JW860_00440 [Sedimentisphaerales bacterium]|nr:hypothetical protein [Sedimentisphaerales bacterium]
MKFDDLENRMRIFETAHDFCVLPGVYIVARLDGRNFRRLTREVHSFEAPYDSRFRDMMAETVEHLMGCGFNIIYGYTQSDEISLLFSRNDDTFNRKLRKLNSILAGEASAKFTLLLNDMAGFDCRISQLPGTSDVVDYFRWRNEDASRNALNGHCYWSLRKQGRSKRQATSELSGMSVARKNELLYQKSINYNELPNWQKRGMGFYWEDYSKAGFNPVTGENVKVKRRRVRRNMELPMKEKYSEFIRDLITEDEY